MVALRKLSVDSDSLLNSFLNSKRNIEIRITVCFHVLVDASCDVSVTLEDIVELKWCLTERTPCMGPTCSTKSRASFNDSPVGKGGNCEKGTVITINI